MKLLFVQLFLVAAALQSSEVVAFSTSKLPQLDTTGRRITTLQAAKGDEQIEKFQVASSRGSGAVKRMATGKTPNAWDSFKSAIYGTVDGVGSLSEKLASSSGDSGVEGGYASIERSVLGQKSNLSPGQRLMKEYKARSTTTPAPTQSTSRSTFDAFKETLYGGVDVASQVFSNDKDGREDSLRSFKPLVQSTLSSSEVQSALPDLQSTNLIKRKIAEGKIKNWEEKERKRQRALERDEAARKFKESVYQIGDAVVASAETLASVPETVSKVAGETQLLAKKVKKAADEIPVKVDKVVSTVTSIPDKVKTKSTEVQKSVEATVENTKQVIEDVKAIPTKVDSSVKETQKKVKDTQESINDVVTSVKVLVGLEKPIPKPPKLPPPPPPTASELAKKLAGDAVKGVVTGTAKVAWWAGKSVAVSAWNGVQSAVENAKNKDAVKPIATKSSLMAINEDVDDEVQEALDLAQSALEFADQKPSFIDKKSNDGKDESKNTDTKP
jgi:hypothetical protein